MPDVDINQVILALVIGGIRLFRYLILHVYIPNLLNHTIFNPIFDWVGDHVVNGEVPGIRTMSDKKLHRCRLRPNPL